MTQLRFRTRRQFLQDAGLATVSSGALAALMGFAQSGCRKRRSRRPNIVLILTDDMGYSDAGCYNPGSRIPTPNIDLLAARGARFTDAHSPSAVCTPARYGLLTGRYAWRTWLKRGVIGGYTPPLIEPARPRRPCSGAAAPARTRDRAKEGTFRRGRGADDARKPGQIDRRRRRRRDVPVTVPWPSGARRRTRGARCPRP